MDSHSKRWWLQKGSARIDILGHNNDSNKRRQEISHTSWLSDDEDAAPWEWPRSECILVDDYSPLRSSKGYAEKLMVSKVCCQVIQTSICDTPAAWSCVIRNKLRQFCHVMQARIMHGIHRKSIGDQDYPEIVFEEDPCMPHTIPSNTSPNTTLTPAPHGPPETITYWTAASWNHPPKERTSPPSTPKTTPEDLRCAGNRWTTFRLPSHERSNTNRALLQVYIKSVTGRTISIRIPNENAKIGTLKDLIWSQEGIPPAAYYLSANARKLDNNSIVTTIGKNPPYFMAMKFGLKGGSRLQRNEREVWCPHDYLALSSKQRQDLPVGTNKPCGQKGKGGIHLWLPHFTLMWTTLSTVLLVGLRVRLNVDNGLAAGITDKGKTEKAKTNCLWVAAIYSIGGIMAGIHIVSRNHGRRKRRNPRMQHQCPQVDQTQMQKISSPHSGPDRNGQPKDGPRLQRRKPAQNDV